MLNTINGVVLPKYKKKKERMEGSKPNFENMDMLKWRVDVPYLLIFATLCYSYSQSLKFYMFANVSVEAGINCMEFWS